MPLNAGTAFMGVEPDLKNFGRQLAGGIDPHVDKAASGITSKLGGAFKSVAAIAGGIGAGLAVGKFFQGTIAEAEEARKTLAQTNAVLASTGGQAGVTAKGVGALADKLSSLTGMDDEAIASTENLLLTFTNIHNEAGKGNDIFDQTTKAVLDMSVALGQDTKSSAIQLGKALNDPIKGITALQRVGVSFTEQQRDQIKTLVESGKTLDAQKLILAEINKEFGGSAAAAASPMDRLKVAFKNLEEEVGDRLLPVLGGVAGFLADRLPGAADAAGRIVSKIAAAFQGVGEILLKGDFSGILARAFNIQEDSPIVGFLFRVRDTALGVFTAISQGVQLLVTGFNNPDIGVAVDSWQGALVRLGQIVHGVFDFIRDNAQPILIGLVAAFVAITSPITAVVAALVIAYTHFEGFRNVVDAVAGFLIDTVWPKIQAFAGFIAEQFGNLVGFVREHWGAIQEAIGHVVAVVQAVIETFVGAVQAVWHAWGDEILNIARIVWDQIRNVVETVVGLIEGIIAAGLAVINGDWGAAWDAIKGILGTAWDFIVETLRNALGLAREAVEGGVSAVVALVGDIPGKILGALGDLGSLLWDAGAAIVRGLLNGIKATIGEVYDFVKGIAGKIADLKGPLDYDRRLLIPAGEAIMGGLVRGLQSEESRLVSELRHITGMFEGFSGEFSARVFGETSYDPGLTVAAASLPAMPVSSVGAEVANPTSAGAGIDYEKLAAAVAARVGPAVAQALRQQPPITRVEDIARGLYDARRR